MEEWKCVEGYLGYEVSNKGNVRSWLNRRHRITNTWRILSPRIDRNGYSFVNLYDNSHTMKSIKNT